MDTIPKMARLFSLLVFSVLCGGLAVASSPEVDSDSGENFHYFTNEKASLNAINTARSICYSAFSGTGNRSMIMIPLPSNQADLDAVCHIKINSTWNAGGIAKGGYYAHDCLSIDNVDYGAGNTSFVTKSFFEANRSVYGKCGSANAFVCCSREF